MIEVPCYGIHRDDGGVDWLLQKYGGSNAIGLKETCPFTVRKPHGLATDAQCNHQVSLDSPAPPDGAWKRFVALVKEDELLRAMLPMQSGVCIIHTKDVPDAEAFGAMTSPIRAVVKPVWSLRTRMQMLAALEQTNLQPLVLTNVGVEDTQLVRDVLQFQYRFSRQLIIVPDSNDAVFSSKVMTLTKRADLSKYPPLPWKQLGTEYIRRIMRGEKL